MLISLALFLRAMCFGRAKFVSGQKGFGLNGRRSAVVHLGSCGARIKN